MDNTELASIDTRMVGFLVMHMQAVLLGQMPAEKAYGESFNQFMVDSGLLRAELSRLGAQRQRIRDLHVPMGGTGGKALCTGCSVGGGEVEWPCATWKITDTA